MPSWMRHPTRALLTQPTAVKVRLGRRAPVRLGGGASLAACAAMRSSENVAPSLGARS
jgi:hypothetical protein